MEGVPALPWAGDAGGRIILPKAVTYEQLAAGAVEFQLYNRQTNALIPTDILRVGDHIEIREKETGGDESPYTIDRYDGARSEIVLTGDGQATRIWGLMGASFDDSVHSVRTFSAAFESGGSTFKHVFVEIDGKMYLPGIKSGQDYIPINDVDGNFEEMDGSNYITGGSVFPIIPVTLEDDPNLGEGAIMVISSIDNIRTYARDCIEIFYKESYQNDEPWKHGQDGLFYLGEGWGIRVNGIWHAVELGGYSVILLNSNVNLDNGENVYVTSNPSLSMDAEASGTNIEDWKESIEEEFGITFGSNILVTEQSDGDNVQPFTNHNE